MSTTPPFGNSIHIFFSVTEAASITDTSGLEIAVPVASRGVLLHRYEPVDGSIVVGFRQHLFGAVLLDTNLAVITPNIVSDPSATRIAIIKTGRIEAGTIPVEPDYFFRAAAMSQFGVPNGGIFIPPGFSLTILAIAVNTAFTASIGYIEYLPDRT